MCRVEKMSRQSLSSGVFARLRRSVHPFTAPLLFSSAQPLAVVSWVHTCASDLFLFFNLICIDRRDWLTS